jgi:hypothetical protein
LASDSDHFVMVAEVDRCRLQLGHAHRKLCPSSDRTIRAYIPKDEVVDDYGQRIITNPLKEGFRALDW